MNYLSVERLSKSFGEKVLFENISFGISQGQKIALVGVNGSGKSTLLKILAGLEDLDSGEVVYNNDVKVAFLDQQPTLPGDLKVLEAILASEDPVTKLIKDYEHYLSDPTATHELSEIMDQMEKTGAWNYENQVKEILGKLGIHDLQQRVGELSGGQKKRVGLAKTLVEKPNLVILDEPTNHLDLDAIEWLENYLSVANMALVMVTHDRYFLDNVTNEVMELDHGKIYRYQGNYADFLEKKAERELNAQAEKEKARNLYRKELEWMRRQPKARGTKAKYRVDAFQQVKEKAHVNLDESKVFLDVKDRRQGGKVLELNTITKSFDNEDILPGFSYVFKKGERIGIVGKNGSGKSTFLNLVTQKLMPDSGEVIVGQTTHIGYYEQAEPVFRPGHKVIDVVRDVAEVVSLSDGSTVSVSKFLTLFNFSVKAQHDYVDKLSGGERRRLQLLLVLIRNPNFLVLDEPTNDLDLTTLRVLEDFVANFKGCIVIVSHDRYFMDRLVDHLFIFSKGKPVRDFVGNYTDYRESLGLETQQPKESSKPRAERPKTTHRKMSFKEKREFEEIENELEILAQRKESLTKQLNSGESDHEKLAQWGTELQSIEKKIDEKEMRWLELSELA